MERCCHAYWCCPIFSRDHLSLSIIFFDPGECRKMRSVKNTSECKWRRHSCVILSHCSFYAYGCTAQSSFKCPQRLRRGSRCTKFRVRRFKLMQKRVQFFALMQSNVSFFAYLALLWNWNTCMWNERELMQKIAIWKKHAKNSEASEKFRLFCYMSGSPIEDVD